MESDESGNHEESLRELEVDIEIVREEMDKHKEVIRKILGKKENLFDVHFTGSAFIIFNTQEDLKKALSFN